MKIGLVLAGAGLGIRMSSGEKKQFANLAGVPVLVRALRPFAGLPELAKASVVLPAEDLERGESLLAGLATGIPMTFVAGGATRQESVRKGLAALSGIDLVLIHDAARPLATRELALRTVAAAGHEHGVVPAVPVSDTLKQLAAERVATLPRAAVYAAQTPQAFPLDMIVEAHRRALADGVSGTDDGALCEHYGYALRLIEGEAQNVKVTTQADWEIAEALLEARERTSGNRSGGAAGVRTGIGFDMHPLAIGRACVLGGVRIESAKGPLGHSDGDVLVHAIMDALLGAAGEPDIGHRFPSDDLRFAGADSLKLLSEIRDAVAPAYELLFVDSVLIAEAPRIAPHVPEMRRRIADALGLSPDRVNVKATTAEGLGAIGRGEGIAAHAVATLRQRS